MASSSSTQETQKRRRVLTEARREQNRLAQRAFREKRRRHRAEQAAVASKSTDLIRSFLSDDSAIASGIDEIDNLADENVFDFTALDFIPHLSDTSLDSSTTNEEAVDTFFNVISGPQSGSSSKEDPPSASLNAGNDVSGLGMSGSQALVIGSDRHDPTPFSAWHGDMTCKGSTLPQSDPFLFTSEIESDAEADLALRRIERELIRLNQLSRNVFQGNATFDALLRRAAETVGGAHDGVSRHTLLRNFVGCESFKLQMHRSAYVLDPYRGNLRLDSYSLFAACLQNAAILGVDVLQIVQDCHSDIRSPFHATLQALGGAQQLELAKSVFPNIARDLEPSVMQYVQDHGMYIDIFPLPGFRERVITLRSLGRDIFDEEELIKDLDANGLLCWGSPWDKRSWEARPWFLRKWWMLLGSKEDHVLDNSKWFWEQRGEFHNLSGSGLRSSP